MYHQYNADLQVDVKKKDIEADVDINYCLQANNKNKIILYLYHNLEIEELKGNNIVGYTMIEEKTKWSPFNYPGQKIKIDLDKVLDKGEKIDIKMKYSGRFDSAGIEVEKSDKKEKIKMNRIEESFVELGLYAPWFPLAKNVIEPAIFNTNISITEGYEVVSRPGTIKRNGEFVIRQKDPLGDCSFIASNDLKSLKNENVDIDKCVYYIKEAHKNSACKTKDLISELVDFYNYSFGETSRERVNIVITPRKKGGAYCRPGFIIYSAEIVNIPKFKLFKNLAHEIAHFWWNKAESITWEDWLNESFANYSVLQAVKNKYGNKRYREELKKYKEKAKNLPAIREVERDTSEETFLTLYCKGTVKLIELEEMIGEESFLELLREVHTKKVNTTSQFLETLKEYSSPKVAKKFNNMLDE